MFSGKCDDVFRLVMRYLQLDVLDYTRSVFTLSSATTTFSGLFSWTTWISRHQKGKPFWILL